MGERPRGPCRYMITRNRTQKLASPWNNEASSDGARVGILKQRELEHRLRLAPLDHDEGADRARMPPTR